MKELDSKSRVHRALRKESVDRIPVFMWFHPYTRTRLAEEFSVPPEALDEVMGNDICMTWVNNNYAMEGIVHDREGEYHWDDWNIQWTLMGGFNQITSYPLKGVDRSEVFEYSFPYHKTNELLANMQPLVPQAQSCFLGCDVSPCVFEMYWRLRGMEDALMDMASDSELIEIMFKRCADFAEHLAGGAIQQYPLDWLWTGDDVASQESLMMSPDSWRSLIKPHLARILKTGIDAGIWTAYHCCGALRPIIPDLVEIGVNVLNPIQSRCPGMDALELKQEFGSELAFMGGVDTQGLLISASPAEVRKETERLVKGMTYDGGGYILAASHTLAPETPLENIFAMYEVVGIDRSRMYQKAEEIKSR